MRRVTQDLSEILSSLQPLTVEWRDDVADRVISRLTTFPIMETYTSDHIRAVVEGGKASTSMTSQDFEDGLLIARTFLGLSKDHFTALLNELLGAGGIGLQRYKRDPAKFISAFMELGLLDAMTLEIHKPSHWTDVLIERLRSGRGSAISGQRRGRAAEDFAEKVVHRVFGANGYEARTTFLGKNGVKAKCDFAIPDRLNPHIVIESKGFGATGSKMSDVIGDVRAIIAAKRTDTAFLFFTDGLTWKQRQSDLRKLIEHQNQGDITRIYTQAMFEQFETDLSTLKMEIES